MDEPEVEAAFHLVILAPPGPLQYRDFELRTSPLTLGREAPADIVIESSDVSRRHARLVRQGMTWLLTDLESTNGTFCDGHRVTEQPLHAGMHFQLGHCELVLLDRGDPMLSRYRRYYNQRRHDELTELPEEIVFQEALSMFLATRKVPLTLVLLEIDDFQRINAEVGREQGDQILKDVAEKLRHRLPSEAQLYRLRGARFGVIRRGDDEVREDTERLIDGVRRGVAASGIETPITLSAGIAVTESTSRSAFVAAAERALASARRLGGGHAWKEVVDKVERPSFRADVTSVELFDTATYVRHPLRRFREILKPRASLFAVELDERQVMAMTNARLFERLERALERAVRDVVLTSARGKAVVGEGVNGHPVFIALDGSIPQATKLLGEVEQAFMAACREEQIAGKLVSSRVLTVTAPLDAIADATRALGIHQAEKRNMLPLPIGHALRLANDAPSNEQRFFALIRLHLALTRWLFSVFAAELVRLGPEATPAFKDRLDEVLHRRVTDGTWVMLTARYAEALQFAPQERLVLPAYLDMVVADKRHVLRELEAFATVRNQFAHGQDARAKHFLDEWVPRIRSLLSGPLAALGDHPVRYVHRVDPIDDDVFDVHYKNLVGDNLAAESAVARRTTPTPVNRIVVEGVEGKLLGLTPFAVYLRCPTCHTHEVFLLDQLDPGPVFKSLRDGAHTVKKLVDAGVDARFADAVKTALDRALVPL